MSQETGRRVLQIEADAISSLIPRLGEAFDLAVELLANCQGRVVATGMGKSGIICRKIAATFSSTGTPSVFLHPAEAVHGDVGMLTSQDVVLALSNSGETEELVKLLGTIKRLGISLISMVGNTDSTLARRADLVLDVDVQGAEQVKRAMPDAVLIFILPPSFQVLGQRLRDRQQNQPEDIDRRLAVARREVSQYTNYDYAVVNDEIERCAGLLRSIVLAERAKRQPMEPIVKGVLDSFK